MPEKMYFRCLRHGHAFISCTKKEFCGKYAGFHPHSTCTITDPNLFKCVTCYGKPKSTSNTCPYYERALHVSGRVQRGENSSANASEM